MISCKVRAVWISQLLRSGMFCSDGCGLMGEQEAQRVHSAYVMWHNSFSII